MDFHNRAFNFRAFVQVEQNKVSKGSLYTIDIFRLLHTFHLVLSRKTVFTFIGHLSRIDSSLILKVARRIIIQTSISCTVSQLTNQRIG